MTKYITLFKSDKASIRKKITVRNPLIKYHLSIIMTKPRINVTRKTTRTLAKTQVCEYVSGKSKLHMMWPASAVESRV